MAEYNPSKIIKDGNTYNFRDDTKIPLAGSNQISGDLVPSTDGTVNLGSSSKKFASLNGIAPDELGLPTSTYTDVSSYLTHFDYTENNFTAPVSGLFYINGSAGDIVVRDITLNFLANFNRNPNFKTCRGMIPVNQGDNIHVLCDIHLLEARIYHLKGKV